MGDPNRESRPGVSHDTEERDLVVGTGDAKKDGYTRIARRPRSGYTQEIVSNETADGIESPDIGFGIPMRLYD